MIFKDYSPPKTPTEEQQRDALRKGLGRAKKWAIDGTLTERLLVDACVVDQRFDKQCESMRTDWLWEMIEKRGLQESLRMPILQSLESLDDDENAYQLCEFAFRFAKNGDKVSRKLLYELVRSRPIEDCTHLGDSEVISLDKDEGFLFVAQVRGMELSNREWEWDDEMLVDEAIELLSEKRVNDLLSDSRNDNVARFRRGWQDCLQHKASQKETTGHDGQVEQLDLDDIIGGQGTRRDLVQWGMGASTTDLNVVLDHLIKQSNPYEIQRLLRVFTNRELPRLDPLLFTMCDDAERLVQYAARRALASTSHPDIRRFAFRRMEAGESRAIALLKKSFEEGDEKRIMRVVTLPDDKDKLHWMLADLVDVLGENSEADSSQLGVIAYGESPCEICRRSAVKLLQKRNIAPDWLLEECQHDANNDMFEE